MLQDIIAMSIAVVCGLLALRMFYVSVAKKGNCGCEKCPANKPQMINITPIKK